jgi:hypothetical protein
MVALFACNSAGSSKRIRVFKTGQSTDEENDFQKNSQISLFVGKSIKFLFLSFQLCEHLTAFLRQNSESLKPQ